MERLPGMFAPRAYMAGQLESGFMEPTRRIEGAGAWKGIGPRLFCDGRKYRALRRAGWVS